MTLEGVSSKSLPLPGWAAWTSAELPSCGPCRIAVSPGADARKASETDARPEPLGLGGARKTSEADGEPCAAGCSPLSLTSLSLAPLTLSGTSRTSLSEGDLPEG